MTKQSERIVLSFDAKYRALVDQIRTKVFEKGGSISMPTTSSVLQRALIDLAGKLGIKVAAPANGGSTVGRPRKSRVVTSEPSAEQAEQEQVEL